MSRVSIASFLVVSDSNVAWYIVALAMVLAIALAGVTAFHDIAKCTSSTSPFRSASMRSASGEGAVPRH